MNTYIPRKCLIHIGLAFCSLLAASAASYAESKPALGNIEGIVNLTRQTSNCQILGTLVYIPGESHFAKLGADGRYSLLDVKVSKTPYTLRVEVPGALASHDSSVLVNRAKVTAHIDVNSVCPEILNCNDQNACTFDSETNGSCSHTPIDCNDNNPSTNDTCDSVAGCQHTPIPTCNNGDTRSCYSGPSGTSGVGACRTGTQTCLNGNYGACTGEVLPSPEICGNNIDDNCNGSIDETCAPIGTACTSSSTCESGSCVQNVCCDSACTNTGYSCNLPGSIGVCTPTP